MFLALVLLAMTNATLGADFPAKPVRMVIPIGPGSSMDIEMWAKVVKAANVRLD